MKEAVAHVTGYLFGNGVSCGPKGTMTEVELLSTPGRLEGRPIEEYTAESLSREKKNQGGDSWKTEGEQTYFSLTPWHRETSWQIWKDIYAISIPLIVTRALTKTFW